MFILCGFFEHISSQCLTISQILNSDTEYLKNNKKVCAKKLVAAEQTTGNITCCTAPSSVGGSLWSSGDSTNPHFHADHPCWCPNHQNILSAPSVQLAMHDAYNLVPVVEKLPKYIESVACYGNNLLLGTREGYLLLYTIRNNNNKIESILEKSNKNFSKKPIIQLEVIPEYHILLSLSDNVVSIHDLTVFKLITIIEKTRGANCFTIDLQREVLQNGDIEYSLKLCVSVKRRLQFYYWKNRQFQDLRPDLNLPDTPKCMVWCVDTMFLGYKKDYFLVSLTNETSKELFSTGKQMEPSILKLASSKISLLKDESTIFVDIEGNATQKSVITWNYTPLQLIYDHPYMVAISTNNVEVRTIDPRCFIQSMEVNKARIICSTNRHHHRQQQQQHQQMIYISSYNSVWLLVGIDIINQIKQLLTKKEFDLALKLVKMSDEPQKDREDRERSINKLFAFELFKQRMFKQAIKLFVELHTDPSHVVGLYPDLLPEEFRSQIRYPGDLPALEGVDMESSLLCLVEFLTQKRHDLTKDPNRDVMTTTLVDGSIVMKPKKQLMQIIDTTLLKCYVQTNDALVGSLLRLKENSCHLEECERVLKAHNKHADLITLYERKGLHTKALDMLLKLSQKPHTSLYGHECTISYLQQLGPKNLDLIFEYSEWVLKKNPKDGLKIFTEDLDEVRLLPRLDVFNFLEKIDQDVLFSYVEHVINEWGDTNTKLHNYLATQYINRTATLYCSYINTIPSGGKPGRTGSEPGELSEMRLKTMKMLQTSKYYQADLLLKQHPQNVLLEERAILCGRLGRHDEVLHIYVVQLQDFVAAEKYCEDVYDENDESSKQVFFDLLKYYLSPPIPPPSPSSSSSSPLANIEAALHLIETYSSYLDIVKVIDLFPKSTQLSTLFTYVEKVLSTSHSAARHSLIQKNLLKAEHLLASESHMRMRRTKVVMSDNVDCKVCYKKIGNSAFARYPNGVIVHCFCCKDINLCPDS